MLRALAQQWGIVQPFDEATWLNLKGGSEHRCRHLPAIGRWEKVTLVNETGWHVDLADMRCGRATPLQYFERLDAAFQLFGDDLRFEGFDEGPGRHDRRLRTSQPDIVGEWPSMPDLVAWLEAEGFEEKSGLDIGAYFAKTFRRGNAWVFDVRPMNFIEADGVMYPIDVIVVFEPQRK